MDSPLHNRPGMILAQYAWAMMLLANYSDAWVDHCRRAVEARGDEGLKLAPNCHNALTEYQIPAKLRRIIGEPKGVLNQPSLRPQRQ